MSVLSAVVGGQADGVPGSHLSFEEGWLDGYCINRVRDEHYPLLVPNQENRVPGLVVRGLKDEEVERIRFFEEAFYEPAQLPISTERGETICHVFLSDDTGEDSGEPWSFESWDERSRRVLALTAEFFMARFGHVSFEEADADWELFVARAEAIVESEFKSIKTG